MDTKQIICLLKSDPLFRGVFSRDTIPKQIKTPGSIIINTDVSTNSGEHWIAIFISKNGKGIYFDSYGLRPLHREIELFLNNNCGSDWKHNPTTLQTTSDLSFTCGHYCVLFCLFMSNNLKLNDFLNVFSRNTLFNDLFVETLVKLNKICL